MLELSPHTKLVVRPREARVHHAVTLADAIIQVATTQPIEFVDLTDQINSYLSDNDIENGNVTVFSRHTTAAIKINEAEELLLIDFKRMLRQLCPPLGTYNHNDMSRRKPPIAPDERPNAHSHLMHLLLSTSETIPVIDGGLALGTWQRVFLVELDGPRPREVMIRCECFHPQERAETVELRAHNGGARRARGK
jgi:secondary thiamine-phosphate synthase enzyme